MQIKESLDSTGELPEQVRNVLEPLSLKKMIAD
jgi:hypothetical protein